MAVYQDSRYAGVDVTALRDASNRTIRYLHSRTPAVVEDMVAPSTVYVMVEGDDLDRLAFLRSKDETKWYLIADINGIFWPFDIEAGTQVLVPASEDFRLRG